MKYIIRSAEGDRYFMLEGDRTWKLTTDKRLAYRFDSESDARNFVIRQRVNYVVERDLRRERKTKKAGPA